MAAATAGLAVASVLGVGGAAAGSTYDRDLVVVTSHAAFDRAARGHVSLEDFTDTDHFPIRACVLDASTREAGLVAGDIVPGVRFSTSCAHTVDYQLNIDSSGVPRFTGGFLDGFHEGEEGSERALCVRFAHPAQAFGFVTNALMGDTFDVRVVHTDGTVTRLRGLSTRTSGDQQTRFYGFVSKGFDVARVSIVGHGNLTFGFALDDFTFTSG